MPLSIEEKKSIIAYRVQKADSVFIEASDNATMNHWNLVANRLYYAVFHMASALLIDKGFTSKTHSGVICLLGQEFATKGLLDKDDNAFHLSRSSDERKNLCLCKQFSLLI